MFDVGQYRNLEISVRGHSPCEYMHGQYIAEIYRPESYLFAADSTGPSSFSSTERGS